MKAVEQREREPAIAGSGPENLIERVRGELRRTRQRFPDLDTIAARLFMSGRGLKRKLGERGTTFRALLDEVQHHDAMRLLTNPDFDIQRIAAAQGYTDPPSFARAFRRWTGQSPSQARARLNTGGGKQLPFKSFSR